MFLRLQYVRSKRYIPILLALTALLILLPDAAVAEEATDATVYLPQTSLNNNGSWVWTTSEPLSLTPTPKNSPVIAIDSTGRVHVFWDTREEPHYLYHSYLANAKWTKATPVAETLGVSILLYAPLTLSDGSLHLLWRTDLGRDVQTQYQLLYSHFDGTGWSQPEDVYESNSSWAKGVAHTSSDGNVLLTVTDGSLSATAYQMARLGSGWAKGEEVRPGFISNWVWPDMQGGIRFYGITGSGGVLYTYWHDGVMEHERLKIGGPTSLPGTNLDSDGSLHVYRRGQAPIPGGTVDGIFYRRLGSDLVWKDEEILSGYNKALGSPMGATDLSGQFVLLWKEEEDGYRLGLWHSGEIMSLRNVPVDIQSSFVDIAVVGDPDRFCGLIIDASKAYRAVCASYRRSE